MGFTKEKLLINEFAEEITVYRDENGNRKQFSDLNDDEMYNALREQNEYFKNEKQEDYRLDFHCSLPAYKFDEKYNREQELKNKYK